MNIVATTMNTTFSVVASLQGATATSPPAFTTPPTTIPAPRIQPVNPVTNIRFDQPSTLAHSPTEAVTVEAVIESSGQPVRTAVTFSSSPQISLVPATVTSDASTGKAATMFAMPDLGQGVLVIGVSAGSLTKALTLTN